jgi:uncharacterized membrane protein
MSYLIGTVKLLIGPPLLFICIILALIYCLFGIIFGLCGDREACKEFLGKKYES